MEGKSINFNEKWVEEVLRAEQCECTESIRVREARRAPAKSVRLAVCSRESSSGRTGSSPAEPSLGSRPASSRSLDIVKLIRHVLIAGRFIEKRTVVGLEN